jgi:predicted enzyme related to lactoylglutathione lyase
MTNMPENGEFCWNELMTSDTGQAQEFYCKLFGWTSQEHPMKNMTYTIFKKGEKGIGGMLQIPTSEQGKIPPHWLSYILVANLDEMIIKSETLGAQVKVGATLVEGMGRFAILMDPTGAVIALWETINT